MAAKRIAWGHGAAGFTVLELAVALLVLTLVFGGLATPIQTQVESRKIDRTQQTLHKARIALLAFAATRGYFPCPADSLSAGREPDTTDHGTGTCPSYYGFLPAATLGLDDIDAQGYAIDGWGGIANRIRYAVINQSVGGATNSNAFTRTNGMRAAGIAALADSAISLFHVCSSGRGIVGISSCGTAVTLVSTAPVMLWSVGPNGATGGTSIDEAQNPNPNGGSADRIFVSRVRSSTAGDEFDDIVAWIPMTVVVSSLIAAGQLP
jgi:type II secretory pathway pseudopilin PulG